MSFQRRALRIVLPPSSLRRNYFSENAFGCRQNLQQSKSPARWSFYAGDRNLPILTPMRSRNGITFNELTGDVTC